MIYHLTTQDLWQKAKEQGLYDFCALKSQGFIHCSTRDQFTSIANSKFKENEKIILLEIDPNLIESKIIFENLQGGTQDFPHIYGPIELNSVVETYLLSKEAQGLFETPLKIESTDEKIERLTSENVSIKEYNSSYPNLFQNEKEHLLKLLPAAIIKRVEHFGSTAIKDICAKPIIDILVEASSLELAKEKVVPILEAYNYDYIWRPSFGMEPPWYHWFIKRDRQGNRTHHIHMIEADFQMWERLLFRDYLNIFPNQAKRYDQLKRNLSKEYSGDRIAYTESKGELIRELTEKAKEYFDNNNNLT